MTPNGVVVVDKPAGMTSHDVVDRVRKIFSTRRVGHAGTLDPDATGVLVLGLGTATRLLSFAQDGPKRYVAQAQFGTTTTSQDASGEVLDEKPVVLDPDKVRAAAAAFEGAISQVPPMVSAVKVGGERLYKKARRGETIERDPREVTIHHLEMTGFDGSRDRARFDVVCSPGTYVRTLIHDLGQSLGCGAHLVALRRTEASGFTETEATPLDDLTTADLRPPIEIVRALPQMKLDDEAAALVADGRPLPEHGSYEQGQKIALVHDGDLVAVYARQGSTLVADKVLPR